MPVSIPRRRPAPAPTKTEAAIGALTSLIPAQRSAPGGKVGGKRKRAGGLALLAGLGAVAFKAKGRRSAAPPA